MAELIEKLKCRFRSDDLKLAASIGTDQSTSFEQKVVELFRELPDPLVTVAEVLTLLGENTTLPEAQEIFDALESSGVLESSMDTQRPLDKENLKLYRFKTNNTQRIKFYALATKRSKEGDFHYQFSMDARSIRSIAAIDRLDVVAGKGEQRSEIVKHVANIANGIKSGKQVPNSVILVFRDDLVQLIEDEPIEGEFPASTVFIRMQHAFAETTEPSSTNVIQNTAVVEFDMPFRRAAFDNEKPAQLVDGQQRTAAISIVDIDQSPNVFFAVNAVVGDAETRKETFKIANSSVKISTDFSRALSGSLSDTDGYIEDEKRIARAIKLLSVSNVNSPFYDMVKIPGTRSTRPIAYNSLWAVLSLFDQSSLDFDNNAATLAKVVSESFSIVRKVWPIAWIQAPKNSKLVHGAGLRAIASVIRDKLIQIMPTYEGNFDHASVWVELEKTLTLLSSRVIWSQKESDNATPVQVSNYKKEIFNIQNTNQDIQHLTVFLLKEVTHLERGRRVVSA